MGDDQQSSGKVLQAVDQRVDRFHVEMVVGFIPEWERRGSTPLIFLH
jgi:hypothetical protein